MRVGGWNAVEVEFGGIISMRFGVERTVSINLVDLMPDTLALSCVR